MAFWVWVCLLRSAFPFNTPENLLIILFNFKNHPASLAQRNPKLLFFTSGVKKLLLNVGALNPQP